MKTIHYLVLLFILPFCLASGADWPEFQGTGRQNQWEETGTITDFKAGPPEKLWSTPVAAGYAGPTVASGKVYLLDYDAEKSEERVLCVEANAGVPLWEHRYPVTYTDIGYAHGPRASVTIADNLAYSLGMMGNLHCFNASTGEVLWSKKLGEELKIDMPIWGLTSSPLVEGDALIVIPAAGPEDACVMAFHRKTGRELWRAFNDKAGYTSPIMIVQGDTRVLVVWTGYRIAGMDSTNGNVYWEIPTKPTRMP